MQASTGGAGAEIMIGADQSQVEAASPISSRPPVDEFAHLSGAGAAGLPDDDEPDRGVSGGNRWPRQETLALLRIRSEMDATFRDATLKGPLWEDVSRKLGELGYRRSAKKCKEKFENVHKYYKRTKEGRAGRQDGKTYKFFTELEALNAATTTTTTVSPPAVGLTQNVVVSSTSPSPMPITSISYPLNSSQVPPFIFQPGFTSAATETAAAAASFSTESASTSEEGGDYEGGGSRKRKRSPKMMEMLEGMMKKVISEQEAMQRRFLEAVDKREQERTAREDAWRRQETARLAREHDLLAHERAVSASRDAAIISFLQKLTGQTIPIPSPPPPTAPPPPPPQQQQHQPQQLPSPAPALMAVPEQQVQEVSGSMSPASAGSRWPKAEVLALIKLRSGLEGRYQEAGPKGPLWEEVSLGMGRMGYKRSSKRCKEKWENINKYFKKVKESNKKRPEDAKTCPYFHQLDALYRKKSLTQQQQQQQQEPTTQTTHDQPSQNNNGGRPEAQVQSSSVAPTNLFGEEATKKPEDIVKDVMMEQQLMVDDYDDKMNESDEDIGEDEDGDEEDEERNGNMEYKIEFQRPNNSSNGGGNNEAPSFFAMVQ